VIGVLDLFHEASCMLNVNLYTTLYSVCASQFNDRAIVLGMQSLHQLLHSFSDNMTVTGTALHIFMKFSDVNEAEEMFLRM
jgi:hypothetical protein